MKPIIEQHNGVYVLRDDLLPGGTKSIFMQTIVDGMTHEYVYASPVYGAFQIALSIYCKSVGKQATIFCAKRKQKHENTLLCEAHGAKIIEVPFGYLSVVEKHANIYCQETGAKKIQFGGGTDENIELISQRMRDCIDVLGFEPQNIFCAVGSGTLLQGIRRGTKRSYIHGVSVGGNFFLPFPGRTSIYKHPLKFEQKIKAVAPFQCSPNYDLKAWEFCMENKIENETNFFWNVW